MQHAMAGRGALAQVVGGPGAGHAHVDVRVFIEAEALDRPALPAPAKELSPTKEQERLDQARHLAKQNPIAVANIVKTWINGEG